VHGTNQEREAMTKKFGANNALRWKKQSPFRFFIDGEYDFTHIMGRILFRVRLGNYIKKFEGRPERRLNFNGGKLFYEKLQTSSPFCCLLNCF
jgi:hypothetical protein